MMMILYDMRGNLPANNYYIVERGIDVIGAIANIVIFLFLQNIGCFATATRPIERALIKLGIEDGEEIETLEFSVFP